MSIELIRDTIDDRWEEESSNVDGRRYDVPKPFKIYAASPDRRKVSIKKGDAIFVYDGGEPTIEPKSMGWVEERIESKATIDLYSSVSVERIEGHRDDSGNLESYGGMKGEVKRILDQIRRGYEEFLYIKPETYRYMHGDGAGGIYRGQWEIKLVQWNTIQQNTSQ